MYIWATVEFTFTGFCYRLFPIIEEQFVFAKMNDCEI